MTNTNNKQMIKCAAYMRYSSKKQGKTSIQTQRKEILAYAKRKGWTVVQEYIDCGFSGRNEERPAFKEMLADVLGKKRAEWDVLLVRDLSRFARNLETATTRKRQIREKDYKVISVTQKYTEDNPGGLEEVINDAMNAETSNINSNKTHESLTYQAEKALHCGGKPPLGYRVDKKKKKLVIDKREAMLVKEIFEMYSVGMSYQEMANILNERGLTTRTDKAFTKNSFHDILKQQKYIGRFVWNRRKARNKNGKINNHAEKPVDQHIIVENACPAIIDKELFDKVQQRMEENKNGQSDSKNRRYYMLGGLKLLKCGDCGRYMTGQVTKSHDKEYLMYRCPGHKAKECSTKDISLDNLNKFVAKAITSQYFNQENMVELNALLKGNLDSEKRRLDKNRLQSVNKAIGKLVKNLKEEKSKTLLKELSILEKEKEALEKAIARSNIKPIKVTEDNIKDIKKRVYRRLLTSDDLHTRKFVQSMVKEVVVDSEGVNVVLAA